ncbi:MAG TPA: encapsulin-associated ferritin-like protein [Gammaproteobacteria bacterium]|nr:encapsulin-associated ferritin-like protein [Gammaproteobacteria bacterium]
MSEPDYLHEAAEDLRPETRDGHRGIRSLMEELEAIDWYSQRVDAAEDSELKAVLAHNRDEEKEHAAMVLEWLRRQDAVFDGFLRRYLFTEVPIVGIEEAATEGGPAPAAEAAPNSLGIGSLRITQ